ncbi:uncharacterized protein LOC128314148 [Acinonyx jubatus]|uniref:Uncharacterized protein LOC128314148 n=1 Tax=Acinonyx jubatus TaxID=32536 RepID=A0ABM3PJS1_ACIJB|nr:uncharacterized protein LOC128314148 [Acinonyx jubatus]
MIALLPFEAPALSFSLAEDGIIRPAKELPRQFGDLQGTFIGQTPLAPSLLQLTELGDSDKSQRKNAVECAEMVYWEERCLLHYDPSA